MDSGQPLSSDHQDLSLEFPLQINFALLLLKLLKKCYTANVQPSFISLDGTARLILIIVHHHDRNVAVYSSTIKDETSQSPLDICPAQTAAPYMQFTNCKWITVDSKSTGALQKVKE